MTLRLAMGTGVVATPDGRPSAIVGLIIPIDDDLLFNTANAVLLAAKLAASVGKTGDAVVMFTGFTHLNPDPEDLDP
jgi:hypothetical protein